MMDTLFALLEPQVMRAYIIKTLQWDLEKCLAFDYYGNRAFGYRYVANYPMLFRIATTYLRVTRDRAFLNQKVGDKTFLEHLDRLALNYQKYLMPDGGLADFGGDPWHFLECVPDLYPRHRRLQRRLCEHAPGHGRTARQPRP